MKLNIYSLLAAAPWRVCLIASLLIAVGCGSFNATIFRSEKTAVDLAYGATHSFNQYYSNAVAQPNLSSSEREKLDQTKDQLYDADIKLSATLQTLDAARAAYALNSADTNKSKVLLLLEAVGSQSTNIVTLVNLYLGTSAGQANAPILIPK